MSGAEEPLAELTSEFAAVALSIDRSGNGPRLRIEDLTTGHVGFLDAIELEALARLPEADRHRLLDPSRRDGPVPDEGG